jgi:hypothetical protein
MRYAAPADVSGVELSVGPFAAVDGYIEVPDDLNEGDRAGLQVNGFTLEPAEAPQKPAKGTATAQAPDAPAPTDAPTGDAAPVVTA